MLNIILRGFNKPLWSFTYNSRYFEDKSRRKSELDLYGNESNIVSRVFIQETSDVFIDTGPRKPINFRSLVRNTNRYWYIRLDVSAGTYLFLDLNIYRLKLITAESPRNLCRCYLDIIWLKSLLKLLSYVRVKIMSQFSQLPEQTIIIYSMAQLHKPENITGPITKINDFSTDSWLDDYNCMIVRVERCGKHRIT